MVLEETFWGCLHIVRMLVVVIVPLMVVMQFLLDYKWLEKLSQKTKFITDFFGMTKDALVPLLIGNFVGLSYGAGAIFFAREQYKLPKEDIFLLMCFLTVCHGIIESSVIYWLIGVNPAALLVTRLALAVALVLFFKKRVEKKGYSRLLFGRGHDTIN